MGRNQHAVIWTRVSGTPEKMGDLLLTKEQAAFTYTQAYLESDQPGFCLLGDGAIWRTDTVTYPISERIPVFPRLLSLIPGNNPRNLQRRHYLDILRNKLGREPPPGLETEWQLLVLGGHGGVGHIDVFGDDIAAQTWYASTANARATGHTAGGSAGGASELWRMLKRNVLDENVDFDPRVIEQTLGPTPSVGGMIPKLLVSLSHRTEATRYFPPDTANKVNVVLKVEPPEYAGLLDLEALCLDTHGDAGFETPAYRRYDDDGLRFLAVERFDRVADRPVPMESLFSVIATGNHQFRETGDILLEELGGTVSRLSEVTNLAPVTSEQLYRRILMALFTGNGDLHLDNLALLGGLAECRLTPVYDPAPMRAWPRHNLVSAIPFDPSSHIDRGAFFFDLGRSFGLSAIQVRQCIDHALEATSSYAARVQALDRVPLQQRQQLVEIAETERALLARQLKQQVGG
jgi:serine/threonine-protein kinase HipA